MTRHHYRPLLLILFAGIALFGALGPVAHAQTFCVPPSTPPKPPPPDEPPDECEPVKCKKCYFSPCHIGTGTYVNTWEDMFVPTPSFGLAVNRRYVSSRMMDGPLGVGWTSSLTPRLYYAAYLQSAPNVYSYEVHAMLQDGVVYKFTSNGTTFTPPASRKDKLIRNGDGSWDLTLEDTRDVLHFGATGYAETLTDAYGNQLGFVYDAQGRLQKIEDRAGSGRYLEVVWGSDGRIASVTARSSAGSQTKTVQYGYGSDGTLTSVTDPIGNEVTLTYTAGRFTPLLSTIRDNWNRLVTQLTFDATTQKLAGYTEGDPAWGGEEFTYSYNTIQPSTAKFSGIGVVSWVLTTNGFPIYNNFDRNPTTGRTTQYNQNGFPHSFTYDGQGRLASEYINAVGTNDLWVKYTYDTNYPHLVTAAERYKNSSFTTRATEWPSLYYTYYGPGENGHGQLKKVERLRTDGLTKDVIEQYAYDVKGRLISREEVGAAVATTFTYDSYGNRITETNSGTMTYGYDGLGRMTSSTDKMGNTTLMEYDAEDRVTAVTWPSPASGAPLFKATRTFDNYDGVKNLLFVNTTDANGLVTKHGYDVMGNMREFINAANGLTKFVYTNNLLQKIVDPNGNETQYTHTYDRRPEKTIFADGTYEQYSYFSSGFFYTFRNRAGILFTYNYDGFQRLRSITWNNQARSIEYVYTGETLTQAKYNNGTTTDITTYTYDALYRPLTETQHNRGKLTYAYVAGNPTTRLSRVTVESVAPVPGSSVYTDYTSYDTMGRVKTMYWSAAGLNVTLNYNLNGEYTSITNSLGHSREYQYDNQGRLTVLTNKRNGSTLASFTYGYDFNWTTNTSTMLGQRTSVTVAGDSSLHLTTGQTKYYYDNKYQLVRTDVGAVTTNWTYDAIGNRLTDGTRTYNYVQNPLGQNTPRLHAINGSSTTIAYDSNGSMKTWSDTEYIWDDLNRLTKRKAISTNNPVGHWFEYDAQGRRTVSEWAAEKYALIHHGQQAVSERRMSSLYGRTDTVEYLYGPGLDEPLAVKTQDGTFAYLVDGLGSVVGKDSSTYQLEEGTSYTAFGQPTWQWPTGSAYTARETVDNLYYYYRSRFYDPKYGRFLSEDPLVTSGGRLNFSRDFDGPDPAKPSFSPDIILASVSANHPYAYVMNDPANGTDPFGAGPMSGKWPSPVCLYYIWKCGKDSQQCVKDQWCKPFDPDDPESLESQETGYISTENYKKCALGTPSCKKMLVKCPPKYAKAPGLPPLGSLATESGSN